MSAVPVHVIGFKFDISGVCKGSKRLDQLQSGSKHHILHGGS